MSIPAELLRPRSLTTVPSFQAGKDADQHKITFPAVHGMEPSRVMARRELAAAHGALDMFGDRAQRLHELADLIVQRRN